MPTSNERKMLSSNEALKELNLLCEYVRKSIRFSVALLYSHLVSI